MIFFIKLYCSLVPISFIKDVDLIGTESEALWSLCLLHLSLSVFVRLSSCTSHTLHTALFVKYPFRCREVVDFNVSG